MKRSSKLIGISVLDKKETTKIASVKDVIFSDKKFRILALLISEGGLFKDAKVIKIKNIDHIGKDAIIVKGKEVIENASTIPEIDNLISNNTKFVGLEVIAEDGESLGLIQDIIIDEDNGKILGFILTDGLIQDLKDGRNVLPFIKGTTFGDGFIFINNKIKAQFDKNKEDFKKLLESD